MTANDVNLQALAALKLILRDNLPAVRSCHLSEAIAGGLGFRTHAALLAHVRAGGTLPLEQYNAATVKQRLLAFGYHVNSAARVRS